MGDNKFWDEAGNSWRKQLEQYDNIQKFLKAKKKEDWLKVAKFRISEEERQEQTDRFYQSNRLVTNQLGLAPEEFQNMMSRELARKEGLHKGSYVSQAKHKMEDLFDFRPKVLWPDYLLP